MEAPYPARKAPPNRCKDYPHYDVTAVVSPLPLFPLKPVADKPNPLTSL